MLRVSFIAFLSLFCFISFANKYKVGHMVCNHSDFEWFKQRASIEMNSNDTNAKVGYNICLFLKGKSTGNKVEEEQALIALHGFAESVQNIPANFFLSEYYATGGNFNGSYDFNNLNKALKYTSDTLSFINTFPNYPGLTYWDWERDYSMEEWSYFRIPSILLDMYVASLIGDFNQRLLDSPNYKGSKNLKTYSQYNYKQNGTGYLNAAIENAGICKNLRKKGHFSQDDFLYIKKVCELFKETAISLKKLDSKRRVILAQPNCQDFYSTTDNPNCPDIDRIDTKMGDIHTAMYDEIDILRNTYLVSSN